jgi:hypothetical protein
MAEQGEKKPAARKPPARKSSAQVERDQVEGAARTEDVGSTKRTVLKREQVLVLPAGVDLAAIASAKDEGALKKLLGGADPRSVKPEEAWVVVGEFEGSTKDQAIRAHAGEPGTPDARQGAYKAPGARAWAGGLLYEAPPQPLVQTRALD